MSNYSRVKDFSVKDALPTGDANKKILGSDMDAELDAIVVSNNTKADKVTSPTSGAYLVQDSNGNLADGGTVISGFSDTLLDDADSATARLTLGVDSAANGSTLILTGTTGQRDGSPAAGYIRGNTTTVLVEWYNGADWVNVGGTPDVLTTQGDVIRADSNGDAERVALGSAGEVFRSDGVDAGWDTPVTATAVQATTSGTAFDFTGIPSWVTRITITFLAVSLSGSDQLMVQLGDAGGIETSGYTARASICSLGGVSGTSQGSGFIILSGAGGDAVHGVMSCVKHDGNEWVSEHQGTQAANSSCGGGGSKSLSDTLTQLRVTRTGTNTFDAGSLNVLYE